MEAKEFRNNSDEEKVIVRGNCAMPTILKTFLIIIMVVNIIFSIVGLIGIIASFIDDTISYIGFVVFLAQA